MFDELWVSRGEYGSVVRGTGLPGALPQLLRTPGLVGAYFPYMDVVGRNIMPVGSEDFQTGWEGSFIPTISGPDAEGWYSISWGSGLNGKYWRTSTAPFACNALASIEVQVLSGAFVLGDASARLFNINATDYSLPTTVSFTSQLYNNSIIYLSIITWDYGGCSMKIRAPRLNLGQSYPYSAPVGLPQVLTDFSGHGNHAQLGSTSGVDTNDPTWGTGGKWLEFDGVDDYTQRVPSAVLQEFTRITILKPDNVGNNLSSGQKTIWSQFAGSTALRSCGIRFYNSTQLMFCSSSVESEDVYVNINVPEMLTTQPQIIGCTYKSGSGQVYVNGSFVSYSGASPTLRDIPDVPFVLMRDPTSFGINGGNIYAHLDINRQCSDAEIIRLHHTLKTLLAGQGVTLS